MTRKAVVKKDSKKDAKKGGEVDLSPDAFLKKVVPILTKMTPEDVEFIQTNHVEGQGVVICPCGKSARVNRPLEGSDDFYVYYDQFRLGLSFPLCKEFTEVLKYHGIVLAQLVPNSVASVMTYIVYLRRIRQEWSLDEFRKHFYCRILPGGYASFATTSALVINGLENKVEGWKDFFCRVSSSVDVNIPRHPSSQKVEPLSKEDKAKIEAMAVKVLDVRQYAKDKEVLRRMIYLGENARLSAEEWEQSDNNLAIVEKKGPAYREPIGRTKSQARLKAVQEAIDAVPEQSGDIIREEVDVPSVSGVGEEIGIEEIQRLLEDEAEKEEVPQKRRRLRKGKEPALVISEKAPASRPEGGRREVNPKVSMEDDLVTIDISKEWFPENVCPEGVARSMGAALYSENLTRTMGESSVNVLRDQLARYNAAAWCIGSHLGMRLDKEQYRSADLENRVNNQTKGFDVLLRKYKRRGEEMTEMKNRYEDQLAKAKAKYEESIKEMSVSLKEALEQKDTECREKVESSKAATRRLRKRIKELKVESAEGVRGGIVLCLDQLSKANAVLPGWDDSERIEGLIKEEHARSKAEAGVVVEERDSDETESDVASTTEA